MRPMFIAAAIVSILTPEPTSRFVPAPPPVVFAKKVPCLLYTSDAADE